MLSPRRSVRRSVRRLVPLSLLAAVFAVLVLAALFVAAPLAAEDEVPEEGLPVLTRDQTHNKLSRAIPPVLTVEPGTLVRFETEEATDGQIGPDSTAADLAAISFDPIHPLTGPVYVKGAEPGDVLAVTLERIEIGSWGWTGIFPGFSFLATDFPDPWLRTYHFEPGQTEVEFRDGVVIPLRPFPGVVAVAPATDEMLSTIPPRANGGNMDDRDLVEGVTVYLPVFVDGALLSIGDGHAAQGDGEVCGTAIEAPLTVDARIELRKKDVGRTILEPQYENESHYAVTAFGESIDEAAKKATAYMIDYLVEERGLEREEAYALASLAAHLKISEVVDLPHMLVTMQVPKSIFSGE